MRKREGGWVGVLCFGFGFVAGVEKVKKNLVLLSDEQLLWDSIGSG